MEIQGTTIIFDGSFYAIYLIPLNYMIRCKIKTKKQGRLSLLIPLPFYSDLERGLREAHRKARQVIESHLEHHRKEVAKIKQNG